MVFEYVIDNIFGDHAIGHFVRGRDSLGVKVRGVENVRTLGHVRLVKADDKGKAADKTPDKVLDDPIAFTADDAIVVYIDIDSLAKVMLADGSIEFGQVITWEQDRSSRRQRTSKVALIRRSGRSARYRYGGRSAHLAILPHARALGKMAKCADPAPDR